MGQLVFEDCVFEKNAWLTNENKYDTFICIEMVTQGVMLHRFVLWKYQYLLCED